MIDPDQVASGAASYFDKLSAYLMQIGKDCPRYEEYQALYKDSDRLQTSLCNFYASIVRCCTEVVRVLQSQGRAKSAFHWKMAKGRARSLELRTEYPAIF